MTVTDVLLCRFTGHKKGERLGRTVWRCERCGVLYQPPRLDLVKVERPQRPWLEVPHGA